jgi:hypothetical protein
MSRKRKFEPGIPIPLVPEDGLYLWDWGWFIGGKRHPTPKKAIDKLVKAFPLTWMQIPERDRNTLTDHWHSKKPLKPGDKPSPGIELNSICLPPNCRAACRGIGFELLFSFWYLLAAKPTAIRHTIAHELGHAISHAHHWWIRHECAAAGKECLACECQAFSYMASWGFDPFYGLLPHKNTPFIIDRITKSLGTR